MTGEREVWSYIAHRDGKFAGAIAGSLNFPGRARPVTQKEAQQWKREISKFCGDFIANGFDITKVYSAAECQAFTKGMPIWKRQEEVEEQPCPDTADLFKTEASVASK